MRGYGRPNCSPFHAVVDKTTRITFHRERREPCEIEIKNRSDTASDPALNDRVKRHTGEPEQLFCGDIEAVQIWVGGRIEGQGAKVEPLVPIHETIQIEIYRGTDIFGDECCGCGNRYRCGLVFETGIQAGSVPVPSREFVSIKGFSDDGQLDL